MALHPSMMSEYIRVFLTYREEEKHLFTKLHGWINTVNIDYLLINGSCDDKSSFLSKYSLCGLWIVFESGWTHQGDRHTEACYTLRSWPSKCFSKDSEQESSFSSTLYILSWIFIQISLSIFKGDKNIDFFSGLWQAVNLENIYYIKQWKVFSI